MKWTQTFIISTRPFQNGVFGDEIDDIDALKDDLRYSVVILCTHKTTQRSSDFIYSTQAHDTLLFLRKETVDLSHFTLLKTSVRPPSYNYSTTFDKFLLSTSKFQQNFEPFDASGSACSGPKFRHIHVSVFAYSISVGHARDIILNGLNTHGFIVFISF